MKIWRKNILSRRNSKFENVEVKSSSVYLRERDRESKQGWNTVSSEKYHMKWGHRESQGLDHAGLQRLEGRL